MHYKPEGYTSLSPYLIVSDAAAVIDFVKAVFGVDPIYVDRAEDGGFRHVEIVIDGSVLMLGEMPGATSAAHLHVYVPDVDAAFARARAAGGTVVQEPQRKEDVDRRGGITDESGTTWWLATQQEPRSA